MDRSRWGSSGHSSGLRTTKGKTSVNNGCRKGTRHPRDNHGNYGSETAPNESSSFEGIFLSSSMGSSSRADVVTGGGVGRGSGSVIEGEGERSGGVTLPSLGEVGSTTTATTSDMTGGPGSSGAGGGGASGGGGGGGRRVSVSVRLPLHPQLLSRGNPLETNVTEDMKNLRSLQSSVDTTDGQFSPSHRRPVPPWQPYRLETPPTADHTLTQSHSHSSLPSQPAGGTRQHVSHDTSWQRCSEGGREGEGEAARERERERGERDSHQLPRSLPGFNTPPGPLTTVESQGQPTSSPTPPHWFHTLQVPDTDWTPVSRGNDMQTVPSNHGISLSLEISGGTGRNTIDLNLDVSGIEV